MEKENSDMVIDMAIKSIEDMALVFTKNQSLVMMGGGTAKDALISRLVGITLLYKVGLENISDEALEDIQPYVDKGYKKLSKLIEEERELYIKSLNEESEDFVKTILNKILSGDPY